MNAVALDPLSSMTPLHIAIIPDGNRRWAKTKGWLPWQGHEKAIENFRELLEYARNDKRIGVLTIWCFSTENWKRDPDEVSKLMTMLKNHLQDEREGFRENNVRFCHSGRKDRFDADLRELIIEIEEETKDNDAFVLNLAIDYGGQDEIMRAIEKGVGSGRRAWDSPEDLREQLDHPELPDIDVIIRTSGEKRTSNFFLWQSTYAEWFFIEKKFPEFEPKDLQEIIDDFSQRERRFGG